MKTLKLFFFIPIIIISCTSKNKYTKHRETSNVVILHEGRWYTNFKNEVFLSCLKKVYPKKFTGLIDSIDASSSANLDQLNFNQDILIIVDSIANDFTKRNKFSWDIEGKKISINASLAFRNSLELDSLTIFFYKKFKKDLK